MIELYHWEPNMFSLKPLIALHEKGLAFKSHYVDLLAFEQYALPDIGSQLEVRHNPEGDGPVLVDRGVVMTESAFINLYLDEAYPETPLRPADAASRWRVLMWARFANEVVAPAVSTLGCHKYLSPYLAARKRSDIEAAIARMPTLELRQAWQAALDNSYTDDLLQDSHRKAALAVTKVEDALKSSQWLAGASYSLADIDLFSLMHTISDLSPAVLANAPKTKTWLSTIAGRAAVKTAFSTSRTGKPGQSFVPGPEHSRWG